MIKIGNLINLINKRFGKLKVLSLDVERNKQMKRERNEKLRSSSPTFWICQCDCGNITSVSSSHLRNSHTTSCGCNYKKYDFRDPKMIGMKFNKWTVLSYYNYNSSNKKHYFRCQCDCGIEDIVDGYNLIHELSKDCGCGRKNTLKEIVEKDLSGSIFNYLTVIKKIGYTNSRKAIYKCQCKCGQFVNVVGSSLISDHTASCGCILSKNNTLIAQTLNRLKIEYIKEKTFKVDNFVGRFDFYLPFYNAVIEYDGEQHFHPVDFAGKGEEWANEQFEMIKKRDRIKNDYCFSNNINLLRIPYYRKDDIEYLIKKFVNLP